MLEKTAGSVLLLLTILFIICDIWGMLLTDCKWLSSFSMKDTASVSNSTIHLQPKMSSKVVLNNKNLIPISSFFIALLFLVPFSSFMQVPYHLIHFSAITLLVWLLATSGAGMTEINSHFFSTWARFLDHKKKDYTFKTCTTHVWKSSTLSSKQATVEGRHPVLK